MVLEHSTYEGLPHAKGCGVWCRVVGGGGARGMRTVREASRSSKGGRGEPMSKLIGDGMAKGVSGV